MENKILILSDVHLCHLILGGWDSARRMENLVENLNAQMPCKAAFFLGDYSLDHWAWNEKGSWLEHGINNTENFVRDYASRLEMPYYMIPGNHEQYGNETWKRIAGRPRQFSQITGGYLFILCDNYSGNLDPDFHSDGTYTPTDLAFVKEELAKYPHIPAVLCAHFFDLTKEPAEFFEFLKSEKRITLLVEGHDHLVKVTELEEADGLCIYHDGHYSHSGTKVLKDLMWGFCAATLIEDGIDIRYISPANQATPGGEFFDHPYEELCHRFFKRRDI